MITIEISNTQYDFMQNTLSLEDEIESRGIATFSIQDLNNQYNFEKGEQVEIFNDTDLIYKGFIEKSTKVPLTHSQNYIHDIQCTDMHYLADKRVVALAETNTTAGSIVAEIVDRYLEAEGVLNTNKYWEDYENMTWQELNDMEVG